VAICEGGIEGDEETGWIHVVGVLPAWRGRGLGLALLRWSFGVLAGAGLRRAALSVDAENTTGAVRLYERAGMQVTQRFQTWERTL
jgi:mycothiol synthase